MKNCRNCKHADWHKTASGRRSFIHRALCKAPVDVTQLPESAWKMIELAAEERTVYSYENTPVDCDRFEKITGEKE